MVHPRPLFIYFLGFKQTLQSLQKINVKNVHPVYTVGIWTNKPTEHESPLLPLDQGSRPE